jgi:hypothetical protein
LASSSALKINVFWLRGALDATGKLDLGGRFEVDKLKSGPVIIRLITPLVVPDRYSEVTLEKKTPPIMFDRTSAGKIIVPGRWWHRIFEETSVDDSKPQEIREIAQEARRKWFGGDVLIPHGLTFELLIPTEDGTKIPHEALPPGTEIRLRLSDE